MNALDEWGTIAVMTVAVSIWLDGQGGEWARETAHSCGIELGLP